MAYGLRIRFEFKDDQDRYHAANLFERDYTGTAGVRELTGSPCMIEYGDSSADDFPTVIGAMATINFYSEDGDDWSDLYTADRRMYRLDIRQDNATTGALIFTGWLMPQEYSANLDWQTVLSIKAICGLGELKEVDYTAEDGTPITGRLSYLDILSGILERIGLGLPIHISIDWRDSSMLAGDAFAQTFVDVLAYASKNCREVLEQLLVGCRIMQRSGGWYVEGYTTIGRDTYTQYHYNNLGVALTPASELVTLKSDIDQADVWTEGTPVLQRWPAYDKIVVNQDYRKRPSFLTNYNIDGMTGWAAEPGVVVTERSDGKTVTQLINGVDSAGTATGIVQIVPIKKFTTGSRFKLSLKVAPLGWDTDTTKPIPVDVRFEVALLNSAGVAIRWLKESFWLYEQAYMDRLDIKSSPGGVLSWEDIEVNAEDPTNLLEDEDYFIRVRLMKAPMQTFGTHSSTWWGWIGMCWGEVVIGEVGEFKNGQSLTIVNTSRYIDKKDDLKLLSGSVPENPNSALIWWGGLSVTADGNNSARLWLMDGGATTYGYCELMVRLLLSLRRSPLSVMRCKIVGGAIEAVYVELNQPGIQYVFTGGAWDLQRRTIDGQWVQLLAYNAAAGDVIIGEVTGGGSSSQAYGGGSTSYSGGTVKSVGVEMPGEMSVSNSPVTGSGTIKAAWVAQAINKVFATPESGAEGAPAFRSLVANDLPGFDWAKIISGVPAFLTAITSLMVTNALGFVPEGSGNKTTDAALGTSDTLYPSQKAVKSYVDTMVAGLLDYRGGYNASGIAFPSSGGSGTSGAIMKGDLWVISVAGTMGGVAVQVGDFVIANTDTPGQSALNWNTLNTNISYVPEDQANKSTAGALGTSDSLYPSQKAVKTYADTKQPLDADLTAIAALAGTAGLLKKTAADTWTLDTSTYLTAITKAMIEAQLTGAITSHTHAAYLTAITKAMVEAVLTGAITSHTHAYQAADADLTAIAALAGTSGLLKKTAADTWALDTAAYLTGAGTAGYLAIYSAAGILAASIIDANTSSVNFNALSTGTGVKFKVDTAARFGMLPGGGVYVVGGSTIPSPSAGRLCVEYGIGIGIQYDPTAKLQIAAGTAGAGTAPIKLTAGTLLTTPEAGVIEYDGSHLYVTVGSTRYQLDNQGASALVDDISFEFRDIVPGAAQTYTLDISASYGYTIESATLETDTGTLTGVSVKIGSTAVTSLSNLTASTLATTASTGAKTVVSTNRVTINTSTGYTGVPTTLRGKLKIQRT